MTEEQPLIPSVNCDGGVMEDFLEEVALSQTWEPAGKQGLCELEKGSMCVCWGAEVEEGMKPPEELQAWGRWACDLGQELNIFTYWVSHVMTITN